MGTEYSFWHMIQNGLPEVHFSRIETGHSSPGAFDVNGCFAGIEAWIELKVDRSQLRPAQKAWGVARYRAGGNLFIASLQRKQGSLEIWTAESAIINNGYPYEPDLVVPTPVIDWSMIRDFIFNRRAVMERINDTKRYATFGV